MKKTLIGAIMLNSLLLVSCGGGDENEKITLPDPPKNLKYEGVTLIDGPLAGYVEVVAGSYTLDLKKNEDEFLLGYDGTMKVKLKFLKSIDVKAGQGYNNFGPSLNGKALDSQGIPLGFDLSVTADTDLATYLKRGSGEEWVTLTISGQGSCKSLAEAENQLEMYKKGKKIRLTSEIVEEEFDTESSEAISESGESSGDSGDCDEFLDGYESFMDDYISIMKKYKDDPSDASILSEYSSVMSEATEWSAKTADCAANPEFASKFMAIQMKISKAASNL